MGSEMQLRPFVKVQSNAKNPKSKQSQNKWAHYWLPQKSKPMTASLMVQNWLLLYWGKES